jgi:hypothetical protein
VGLYKLKALRQEYKEIINKCKNKVDSKVRQEASNKVRGNKMIIGKLKELVEANKLIF